MRYLVGGNGFQIRRTHDARIAQQEDRIAAREAKGDHLLVEGLAAPLGERLPVHPAVVDRHPEWLGERNARAVLHLVECRLSTLQRTPRSLQPVTVVLDGDQPVTGGYALP